MPRLDHVVLAVRDLDQAARHYEALGFTLTPRATHPFGTGNRLTQFAGSFLEVLTVVDPDKITEADDTCFSFGAFNRDFLAAGEGFSMLVLSSDDADADRARFAAAGLKTYERFDFERTAVQPDGTPRTVAFRLAFTSHDDLPHCGFFTCQNRFPDNFWKPAFQSHANTARDIAEIALVVGAPARVEPFMSAYANAPATGPADHRVIETMAGTIALMTPATFQSRYGAAPPATNRLLGLTISVSELAKAPGEQSGNAKVIAMPGFQMRFVEG